MRRILIPLVFAALLTIAAVVPAAASSPAEPPEELWGWLRVLLGLVGSATHSIVRGLL